MRGKKILALMLSLSMILSLFSFSFVSAEEETVSEYASEIKFLTTLGIFNEDFDEGAIITKAKMAELIAVMLHPDLDFSDTVSGESVFNDVPPSHESYSYIKACKQLEIVKGDYNNNFYPEHQITTIEAMTMVINALGYTLYANAFGGYPTGYYTVASQTGISKGINLSNSDAITGDIAAKIIYNAMFADMVEIESVNQNGVEISVNSNKNLLSERLGIFEYDGIVVDNGITAIDRAPIADTEKAVIKEVSTGKTVTAYINGTDIASMIGLRVKAFIRNNVEAGRYEYVFAAPHTKSKILTINAKDVTDVTSEYVEYEEDENSIDTKKVKLPQGKPVIIYNGVTKIDKTLEELMPKDGFITFVENSGDNSYDVVIIYSFNYNNGEYDSPARNIIVDNVTLSEGNEGISCSFNPANSIELNDDKYMYSFILNEEYKSLYDIKAGMVVSVAEAPELIDGKTYYFLAVNNKTVDGTLSGTGDNSVYIGDDEYKLSSGLTKVKPNFAKSLKIGKEIKVILDITGKMAYAESEDGLSKNYAYIIKSAKETRGDEYILVKYFGKDGKILTLPLSEKAKIDGVSVVGKTMTERLNMINSRPSVAALVEGAAETGRPAIIEVRDDKIVRIDTDTPNPDLSSGKISEDYIKQSPIQYYEDDADSFDTLKAGFRSPRATDIKDTCKSVAGKFFVTSETVIISVPEIDTYAMTKLKDYKPYGQDSYYLGGSYAPDMRMIQLHELENTEKNYKIVKASALASAYAYDIQGYDIDPDTGVAGLAVLRGRSDVYRSGDVPYWKSYGMSIFLRKTTVYDEEAEDIITKIYYSERGEEKSATIDLNEAYYPYKALINGAAIGETPMNPDFEVEALEEGDIIRITQNEGKLTHIERVLNLDKYKEAGGYVYYPSAIGVPYSAVQSGTRAKFPYDMPVPSSVTPNDSYSVIACYAKSVNSSTIRLITTLNPSTKFSSIDIDDPSTYSEQFYKSLQGGVVIINIAENGNVAKVDVGTITDIVSLEDTDNDITKASMILLKVTDATIEQVFIINGVNNL